MNAIEIELFPCLTDNYGFLVHDRQSGETACVDTPDATEILTQANRKGWKITQIWNTHHHPDHTGGNLSLKQAGNINIIGAKQDAHRLPGITHQVEAGTVIYLGAHKVQIFATPGHTTAHISYYIPDAEAAFVGDTLFALGCGRLFEGTATQMFNSLQAICDLPDSTRLYCAHEYTLANGRFALTVEPENQNLKTCMLQVEALRKQGLPTIPTSVAQEKKTNPFVRAKNPQYLAKIRHMKDSF